MLRTEDADRVRTITLDRPDALNAFNEKLYDATALALRDAADDPGVAVVVITGTGRAFSAGTDVIEMASRTTDPTFEAGELGFPGLVDELAAFPKPLLCAVNGMALGIGATMLGFADLVFMSSEARIRCPFSDLAVAPEAASSYTFPLLLGRQNAMWVLLSSEWFSAEECKAMGLAWKVTTPDTLMDETLLYARKLASKSIPSLVHSKKVVNAAAADAIAAARQRENDAYAVLLGAPANLEAFAALAERRPPDFVSVDAAHSPG